MLPSNTTSDSPVVAFLGQQLEQCDLQGQEELRQTAFTSQAMSSEASNLMSGSSSNSSMTSHASLASRQSVDSELSKAKLCASRGRPYVSTWMARKRPSATPYSQRNPKIVQGSLYQQLRANGVTEEVAYERQSLFYRLHGIVSDL